jgi:hypothetical protein
MTDTDGRLLNVEVHAADIQDRDGAKGVLKRSRRSFPFVEIVFADGAYAGRLVAWADYEVPSPRSGLRAAPVCRRNPHHHRSIRNPPQAMGMTLLKHTLSVFCRWAKL